MKLYFVRHGLTNSNVEQRLMGSMIDESLNEEGKRQVEELACALPSGFDKLFSSTLKRARESAEYISKQTQLPIEFHQDFREIDSGTLCGMKWIDVADMTGGEISFSIMLSSYGIDYSAYGGETKEAVSQRLQNRLFEIKKYHKDKKVLIVTHGGVIRALHGIAGRPLPPKIGNAFIFELEL